MYTYCCFLWQYCKAMPPIFSRHWGIKLNTLHLASYPAPNHLKLTPHPQCWEASSKTFLRSLAWPNPGLTRADALTIRSQKRWTVSCCLRADCSGTAKQLQKHRMYYNWNQFRLKQTQVISWRVKLYVSSDAVFIVRYIQRWWWRIWMKGTTLSPSITR